MRRPQNTGAFATTLETANLRTCGTPFGRRSGMLLSYHHLPIARPMPLLGQGYARPHKCGERGRCTEPGRFTAPVFPVSWGLRLRACVAW
jgi:hypothetical protein